MLDIGIDECVVVAASPTLDAGTAWLLEEE